MRQQVKDGCSFLALLAVLPFGLAERLARHIAGRDVWFGIHAQLFSVVPGKTGNYLRNAYYSLTLRSCPRDCCFHFGSMFTHSDAEVGHRVILGLHSVIGLATIADDCLVGENVHLISGRNQHGTQDPNIPFRAQPGAFTRVSVGRNCWLGACSVVMADVSENCVVGAGAVVTRPFPANRILVGNPARATGNVFDAPVTVIVDDPVVITR